MSREETTQPQEPVYRFYERSVSTDGCQGVGCTSGRQKGGGYRHFMRPHKASVSPSRMCKSSTFYGHGAKDTQTRERLPRMRPKIYDCVSICANVSAEHGSGQGRLCEGEGLRVWPQNRRLGKKHMMISSTRNADYAWGPANGQQVASVCLSVFRGDISAFLLHIQKGLRAAEAMEKPNKIFRDLTTFIYCTMFIWTSFLRNLEKTPDCRVLSRHSRSCLTLMKERGSAGMQRRRLLLGHKK